MSGSIRIRVLNAAVEVDRDTAADLLCGLTATLEVESDGDSWRDEHFPVLELALALRRRADRHSTFRFSSMCMEEDPVLIVAREPGQAVVEMYDGTRIQAPEDQIELALTKFVSDVDRVVCRQCRRTITDIEASLR